ncbi:chorion class CA protein ERA.2-like isoform X1 [Bombyx mori]|uniref:Chorion class A n=2 Tax=Bombyx mori TaxID=7091 RepID=A0A8R2ASG6_BOMMO|nr:chorion class CA protein ERA.2-like [Bombyx mori]
MLLNNSVFVRKMGRWYFMCLLGLFAQNALSQVLGNPGCACNVRQPYAGNVGCNAPCGGPAGYGDVAVSGELPVGGNTGVCGNVPVVGYVMFEGTVPAGGLVSVANNCGCNGPAY